MGYMRSIGLGLAVGGFIWAVMAFNMSTTVVAGGRSIGSGEYSAYIPITKVSNLSLMDERRNHLMMAGVMFLAGIILFGFGSIQAPKQGVATDSAQTSAERSAQAGKEFVAAIGRNDLASMRRLMDSMDVSPHGRNERGRGWLQYATAMRSVDACKVLLAYGARATDEDELGGTALKAAAGNPELLALFQSNQSSANL